MSCDPAKRAGVAVWAEFEEMGEVAVRQRLAALEGVGAPDARDWRSQASAWLSFRSSAEARSEARQAKRIATVALILTAAFNIISITIQLIVALRK